MSPAWEAFVAQGWCCLSVALGFGDCQMLTLGSWGGIRVPRVPGHRSFVASVTSSLPLVERRWLPDCPVAALINNCRRLETAASTDPVTCVALGQNSFWPHSRGILLLRTKLLFYFFRVIKDFMIQGGDFVNVRTSAFLLCFPTWYNAV